MRRWSRSALISLPRWPRSSRADVARPVACATGLTPRGSHSSPGGQLGSGRWSPLVQLEPRHSPRSAARVRPLCALAARSPLCALVARLSPLVARPKVSCRAGPVAGSPCPDGLPPLFFSAAQSPARANSAGIRSLSSVPHLWSSSFDCPASQVKRRPKCDRIAPSHPLSWPCVSDLLLLKGES